MESWLCVSLVLVVGLFVGVFAWKMKRYVICKVESLDMGITSAFIFLRGVENPHFWHRMIVEKARVSHLAQGDIVRFYFISEHLEKIES